MAPIALLPVLLAAVPPQLEPAPILIQSNSLKAAICVFEREPETARAMVTEGVPSKTNRSIADRFVKVMGNCGLEGQQVLPLVVKGYVAELALRQDNGALLRAGVQKAQYLNRSKGPVQPSAGAYNRAVGCGVVSHPEAALGLLTANTNSEAERAALNTLRTSISLCAPDTEGLENPARVRALVSVAFYNLAVGSEEAARVTEQWKSGRGKAKKNGDNDRQGNAG